MKIAICGKRFVPAAGGAETFTIEFARGLARRGHDVHVFAFDAKEPDFAITLHRVPVKKRPKATRDLSFAMRCRCAVLREEFDVVFGLGKVIHANVIRPGGGVFLNYVRQNSAASDWIWGVPVRWARHVLSPKSILDQWIEKRAYQCAALKRIVSNSKMVKRHLIARFGFDDSFVSVIHNGADLERFHPKHRATIGAAKRRELGIADDDFVMLFVANNPRLKGATPLFQALERLRDLPRWCIVVLGKGKLPGRARLAMRAVRDRVMLVGQSLEPEAYFAAADLLVHPTFYDPCANVTMEALASGVPVITSVFDGASELITSGREGIVLRSPRHVEKLANAIRSLMNEDRRAVASNAARALAERNSFESCLERYCVLLEEVAQSRSGEGSR